MPRLSLAAVIPPILIAVLLGLSYHRLTAKPDAGPPPPTTAAAREAAGTGQRPAQPPAANVQAPQGG